MVNINWDKINTAYHGSLSTATNAITSSTSEGIGGTILQQHRSYRH